MMTHFIQAIEYNYLPHQVKTQYVHFRFHGNYLFYLGKFLKKLEDD